MMAIFFTRKTSTELTCYEVEIQSLLDKKTSKSAIARKFGVCRKTVTSFIKKRLSLPVSGIYAMG